jgi:hypothetical protein
MYIYIYIYIYNTNKGESQTHARARTPLRRVLQFSSLILRKAYMVVCMPTYMSACKRTNVDIFVDMHKYNVDIYVGMHVASDGIPAIERQEGPPQHIPGLQCLRVCVCVYLYN